MARLRSLRQRCSPIGLWARTAAQLLAAGAFGAAGFAIAAGGKPVQAVAMLALAALLALVARRSWALASRATRLAASRRAVVRALGPLAERAWRVQASVAWGDRQRIDQLAVSPDQLLSFAVLAMPGRPRPRDLYLAQNAASWLGRERSCIAVCAVTHTAARESLEGGVLVVPHSELATALFESHDAFADAMEAKA